VSGARFGEAGQRMRAAQLPEQGGENSEIRNQSGNSETTATARRFLDWRLHDRFAKRLACRAARGRDRRTGGAAPKKERPLYAARARIFPAWAVFYGLCSTDATPGVRRPANTPCASR